MAGAIDVHYEWWIPATVGMQQYGPRLTEQADAEEMYTNPASMLPDTSRFFKIEHTDVEVPEAGTVTRRTVTELPLPARDDGE